MPGKRKSKLKSKKNKRGDEYGYDFQKIPFRMTTPQLVFAMRPQSNPAAAAVVELPFEPLKPAEVIAPLPQAVVPSFAEEYKSCQAQLAEALVKFKQNTEELKEALTSANTHKQELVEKTTELKECDQKLSVRNSDSAQLEQRLVRTEAELKQCKIELGEREREEKRLYTIKNDAKANLALVQSINKRFAMGLAELWLPGKTKKLTPEQKSEVLTLIQATINLNARNNVPNEYPDIPHPLASVVPGNAVFTVPEDEDEIENVVKGSSLSEEKNVHDVVRQMLTERTVLYTHNATLEANL